MTDDADGSDGGELRERLAADVRRVADRLRGLSAARLAAQCPPYGTVADAGRAAAASLAEAALAMEGRDPRPLPRLGDFAVGDQVAVTGQDLLDALRTHPGALLPDVLPDGPPGQPAHGLEDGPPGGPAAALARAADVLADVRRRI